MVPERSFVLQKYLEIKNPDRERKLSFIKRFSFLDSYLEIKNPDRGRKLLLSTGLADASPRPNLEIKTPNRRRMTVKSRNSGGEIYELLNL